MRRSAVQTAAALSAAALALSACGSGDGGDGGDENVTLTMTWWGGDVRHDYTQEMIALFEEEHPNITVDVQYTEWDGYWDQLATQTAAQDTPDVVQMDLVYLREYIENGVLLELDESIIDTSEFTEELIDTGRHEDALYAMPVGSTSLTYASNPDLFEEAGVEMPDDTSWTWEDLLEITTEISENTDAYGAAGPFDSAGLEAWIRQNLGTSMVDEQGQLTWEPEDIVPYLERQLEFQEAGAYPEPAEIAEQRGISREQTLVATGEAALFPAWDTMLVALSSNEGVDLEPLMLPSETGSASEAEMYYKASMFYSVYAGSDHPEEAQMLVDFLVNNEEAGQLQQIERGIPGNESIRDLIREDLDDLEARVLEYNEEVGEYVSDAPPLQPEGYGSVQDIVMRYEDELFFGRMSPEEVAEALHAEIEGAIS
ncbi:ABC transporter substrate-binding protein [Nesterenkonia sp.]|uniref:ABC transporter substrate-binding protein n=1 Tax=Nesterenkonia sp. TaxID=704201 RepID=UPI00263A286B|nr:ABC transporter substrate-binding protein [Nesterenkonia sp.]